MPRPIGPDTPIRLTQATGGLPEGTTGKARGYPQTPVFWTEPAVWIYPDNKELYPRWVPLRCVAVIPDEANPEEHAEYAVNRELTAIETEPTLRDLAQRIQTALENMGLTEVTDVGEELGVTTPGQAIWGIVYCGVGFSLSLNVTE